MPEAPTPTPSPRGLLAGGLLAGVTILAVAFLPERDAFQALAVLLAAIAAVYVGSALAGGRVDLVLVEGLGAVAFVALAVLALRLGEPILLGAGYVGHALWDAAHRPRLIDTPVRRWYVDACLVYDVPVGVFAFVWFA